MERLQKILARAGVASRRKAANIINQGRVKVNGQVVTTPGSKFNVQEDDIKVDGKLISKEEKIYILLHKPEHYVSTVDDPRNRKTVLDLIGDIPQRIYPVGRLDYDSSGLILLTNDGDLTYVLTHPSFEIKKTYLVEVKGNLSEKKIKKLENGIKLKDGITAPAEFKLLDSNNQRTIFTLTIHEGRNRQIRRMAHKIGHPVKSLKRTSLSFLTLEGLSAGEYRFLKDEEINKLKKLKKKKQDKD